MSRSTILAALALLAVACGVALEPGQFRLIGENITATDAVALSSAGPT